MDTQSQALLDTVLAKDISELTSTDKAVLKARASYLSKEQRATYKGIFKEKVEEVVAPRPQGTTRKENISYKELQKKAKALGMEKYVAVSRADLELFITTHEGPGEPPASV